MKFLLVFRSSVSVPTGYFLLRRCDDRRTNVSLPRTRIVVTIEISFPAVDHETCSHGCERYTARGNLIALSRRKRSRQIETCFATIDVQLRDLTKTICSRRVYVMDEMVSLVS